MFGKTHFGPQMRRSYPKLGPKSCTPCFQNLFLVIILEKLILTPKCNAFIPNLVQNLVHLVRIHSKVFFLKLFKMIGRYRSTNVTLVDILEKLILPPNGTFLSQNLAQISCIS